MPRYKITIDAANRTTRVELLPVNARYLGTALEPIDELANLLVCERHHDDYSAAVSIAEAMAYGIQVGRRFAKGHPSAESRHRAPTTSEVANG